MQTQLAPKLTTFLLTLLLGLLTGLTGLLIGTTFHLQSNNFIDNVLTKVIEYLYYLKNLG